jgi:thiamine biosynthesis protein ThiI
MKIAVPYLSPKTPSTNPNLKVVERLEKSMPWLHEAEKIALETREIQTLSRKSEKAFNNYFT